MCQRFSENLNLCVKTSLRLNVKKTNKQLIYLIK